MYVFIFSLFATKSKTKQKEVVWTGDHKTLFELPFVIKLEQLFKMGS